MNRVKLSWGQPSPPVTVFTSNDVANAREVAANFFCTFRDDRLELVRQRVHSSGSSHSQATATTALGPALEVMPRGFAPFITCQPRMSGRRPTTVRCRSLRDHKRTAQAERNKLGIGRDGVRSPPQRVLAALQYADAELCGIDTGLPQRMLTRL